MLWQRIYWTTDRQIYVEKDREREIDTERLGKQSGRHRFELQFVLDECDSGIRMTTNLYTNVCMCVCVSEIERKCQSWTTYIDVLDFIETEEKSKISNRSIVYTKIL